MRRLVMLGTSVLAVVVTLMVVGVVAAAAASLKLTPGSGPPGTDVTVTGSGFGAHEAVDVYLDTTARQIAVTNASGHFPGVVVTIPGSALPGTHWISAVGRTSDVAFQKKFVVQSSWTQMGYSGARTGFNPFENVIDAAAAATLDTAWTTPIGSPFGAWAGTVVTGGVAYTETGGQVAAVRASDGSTLWTYPLPSGLSDMETPAIGNGFVYATYAGSSGGVPFGAVAAFPTSCAAGCTPSWTGPTNATGFTSDALVAGGFVYVISDDGNLYVFDAAGCGSAVCSPVWTGTPLPTQGVAGVIHVGEAAALRGRVYVRTTGGLAVFAAAGCGSSVCAPITTVTLQDPNLATRFDSGPTIVKGEVFLGTDNGLVEAFDPTLNALGATPVVSNSGGQTATVGLAATGNRLIVATSSGIAVYNIGASESSPPLVWQSIRTVNGPLSVADGVIYSTTARQVFAYDLKGCGAPTCDAIWQTVDFAASPSGYPVAVVDGRVLVSDPGGELNAFEPAVPNHASGARPNPALLRAH